MVVIYAPTEESFLDATNSKYESGGIVSLDVYSHGTANSISLGGEASDKDRQEHKRWVSVQDASEDTESPLKNEFTNIDASNFSSSPRCTLWGCNQGGDDSSRKAKSPAQALVDQVGGTTKAFVGGGDAEFIQQNRKNIYDGTMIRSADRKSQKTNLTTFKRNKPWDFFAWYS